MPTNTTAHIWLRKVIDEHESANNLSRITGIPVNNFYFWLNKSIEEGEDLIKTNEYVTALRNVSRFKTLAIKLMPSLKLL